MRFCDSAVARLVLVGAPPRLQSRLVIEDPSAADVRSARHDWVQLPQRFPVRVKITGKPPVPLRIGQTVSVAAQSH